MANPLVALGIETPDIGGAFLEGQQVAQTRRTSRLSNMINEFKLREAQSAAQKATQLEQLVAGHGAGAAAGREEDIGAIAGTDPELAQKLKGTALTQQDSSLKNAHGLLEFMHTQAKFVDGAPAPLKAAAYGHALQEIKKLGGDISSLPQEWGPDAEAAVQKFSQPEAFLSAKDEIAAAHDKATLAQSASRDKSTEAYRQEQLGIQRAQVEATNRRTDQMYGGVNGGGRTKSERDRRILLTGDPASADYAAAFADYGADKVLADGTVIKPDMQAFKKPTFQPGGDTALRPFGAATRTPGSIKAAAALEKSFNAQVTTTKSAMSKLTSSDRTAAQTGLTTPRMADAATAFNLALSMLRDPAILNTGVLQKGELDWINSFMSNPRSFNALVMGNDPTFRSLDQATEFLNNRLSALRALDENAPSASGSRAEGDNVILKWNAEKGDFE